MRAHLPILAARILAGVVTLGLLAAAAWVARDSRRTSRDRDIGALTLCLAAALSASPIVWVHYFLLLLVPLALASPRLSPLWLVPLAYQPLGEAAWPALVCELFGVVFQELDHLFPQTEILRAVSSCSAIARYVRASLHAPDSWRVRPPEKRSSDSGAARASSTPRRMCSM